MVQYARRLNYSSWQSTGKSNGDHLAPLLNPLSSSACEVSTLLLEFVETSSHEFILKKTRIDVRSSGLALNRFLLLYKNHQTYISYQRMPNIDRPKIMMLQASKRKMQLQSFQCYHIVYSVYWKGCLYYISFSIIQFFLHPLKNWNIFQFSYSRPNI